MRKKIVIRPLIREKFQEFLQGQRILFFSAPCGFGKTTVAEALLSGRAVLRRSGEDEDPIPKEGDWNILLVDDFQRMPEENVLALCQYIRSTPDRRFVFLSRGVPPGCMMAFQYAGIMGVISAQEMLFDEEDIQTLFRLYDVPVTRSEVSGILKESIGYALGVAITVRLMASGRPFGPELVKDAFQEVYRYFEAEIFMPLDLTIRLFLLELAPLRNRESGNGKNGQRGCPGRTDAGLDSEQFLHAPGGRGTAPLLASVPELPSVGDEKNLPGGQDQGSAQPGRIVL